MKKSCAYGALSATREDSDKPIVLLASRKRTVKALLGMQFRSIHACAGCWAASKPGDLYVPVGWSNWLRKCRSCATCH